MSKKLFETHKKSGKHDGIKPPDKEKSSKKNPSKFENFQGEKID
ncbi:hypothetical protein ACER0A_008560 [Haloimpatiens sp. FM7315]